MPTYTPDIIQGVLDDVDTLLCDAVKNGTLKKTFEHERHLIVSLQDLFEIKFDIKFYSFSISQNNIMVINQHTRADEKVQAEFDVPQFFWDFVNGWQTVKAGDRTKSENFWYQQEPVLEKFDRKYPNHF